MSKRKKQNRKHQLKTLSQLEALQSVRKLVPKPSFPLMSKRDKAKRKRRRADHGDD
jgi:hypothetical protein